MKERVKTGLLLLLAAALGGTGGGTLIYKYLTAPVDDIVFERGIEPATDQEVTRPVDDDVINIVYVREVKETVRDTIRTVIRAPGRPEYPFEYPLEYTHTKEQVRRVDIPAKHPVNLENLQRFDSTATIIILAY